MLPPSARTIAENLENPARNEPAQPWTTEGDIADAAVEPPRWTKKEAAQRRPEAEGRMPMRALAPRTGAYRDAKRQICRKR
jgi:hypothetical protein